MGLCCLAACAVEIPPAADTASGDTASGDNASADTASGDGAPIGQDQQADSADAADTGGGDTARAACPGGLGCPCASPVDCDDALCLETAEGLRCSRYCGDGACPAGWSCLGSKGGRDAISYCIPEGGLWCRPCLADADCTASAASGARCVSYGHAGAFCGTPCDSDAGCGPGAACRDVTPVAGGAQTRQCVAKGAPGDDAALGVCPCSPHARAAKLWTACSTLTGEGAQARRCLGSRACGAAGLGPCEVASGAAAQCMDVQCLDAITGAARANGTPCDDGRACTKGDVCAAGQCEAGSQVCPCEPGHLACSAWSGADSANLCKGGPTCVATAAGAGAPFACVPNPGTTVQCDSSLDGPCLQAACVPLSGACTATASERVQLVCDLAAGADGKPGCRKEVKPASAADGPAVPCDDGLACSLDEVCAAGACTASDSSACGCLGAADCPDDDDKCNGKPYCDKSGAAWACKVNPASVVVCDVSGDGPCAATACVAGTGTCATTPKAYGSACSDGVACSDGDVCDGQGSCAPGAWVCCKADADCAAKEDGDLCNGTLYCHKASGACLVNPATVLSCPNAADTACAKATCTKATGACVSQAVNGGGACDDGDPCSQGEVCANGVCGGGAATCLCQGDADCKSVDDGNLCNGTLYCHKASGTCKPNPATVVSCPTVNDTACRKQQCAATTGACVAVDLPTQATCDADGTGCTANDACDGAGACKAGVAVCACGADADCAAKEDGDLCNGTLFCDKAASGPWGGGACKLNPASVKTCPPGGPACTVPGCVPQTGACAALPLPAGATCSDGDPCTPGDGCDGKGACEVGAEVACDDGNPCTADACDGKGGCVALGQSGKACDDGVACTVGDACAGGECMPGAPHVLRVQVGSAGGGEYAYGLGMMPDKGAIVVGHVTSKNAPGAGPPLGGASDGWLFRLDAQGKLVWSQRAGGAGADDLSGAWAAGEALWAVGRSDSQDLALGAKNLGSYDCWVIRVDGGGKLLTALSVGGAAYDGCEAVAPAAAGGVVVVGRTSSVEVGVKALANNVDGLVARVGADGALAWVHAIGGDGSDSLLAAAEAPAGGIVAAGYSSSKVLPGGVIGSGDYDGWILRLDAGGKVLWHVLRGGAGAQSLRTIVALPSGGFIAGGGSVDAVNADGSFGTYAPGSWTLRVAAEGSFVAQAGQAGWGVTALLRGADGTIHVVGSHGEAAVVARLDAALAVVDAAELKNVPPLEDGALRQDGRVVAVGRTDFGKPVGAYNALVVVPDAFGHTLCGDVGVCLTKKQPDCADSDACTIDSCDATKGCTHTAKPCDDGNACTADACDGGACTAKPLSGPCEDGDKCTAADACQGSTCKAGPPIVCDDNNPCTEDFCQQPSGCDVVAVAEGTPCAASPYGACEAKICQKRDCPLGYRVVANPGGSQSTTLCEAVEPVWGQRADQPAGVYTATTQGGGKVVIDKQTGLWWHGGTDGPKSTWLSAKAACDQLTHAGKDDWRLPSPLELSTLVGYIQSQFPFTDVSAFPQTQSDDYWTSQEIPGNATYAWMVSFATGGIGGVLKTGTKLLRCVRTATPIQPLKARYVATSAVVQDQWTGRTWQRDGTTTPMTWAAAVAACDGLSLGGSGDWRLPSVRELLSIYRADLARPAVDPGVFGQTLDNYYWVATKPQGSWIVKEAWAVSSGGGLNYVDSGTPRGVRCVRP